MKRGKHGRFDNKCPECGSREFVADNDGTKPARRHVTFPVCRDCGTRYVGAVRPRHGLTILGATLGCVVLAVCAGVWVVTGNPGAALCPGICGLVAAAGVAVSGLSGRQSKRIDVGPKRPAPTTQPEPAPQRHSPPVADEGRLSDRLATWLDRRTSPRERRLRTVRRSAGYLSTALGVCLALLTAYSVLMTQGYRAFNVGEWRPTPDASRRHQIDMATAAISGVLASLFWAVGRRLAQPSALELLQHQRRRPVLLLRAFDDDHAVFQAGSPWGRMFNPLLRANTVEDVVAGVFRKSGPVIAIANPRHSLPPSGAGRVWLSDHEWNDWATDLLEWSRRVIMLLGDPNGRPGLTWEIEQVFTPQVITKLTLVIPPHLSESLVRLRWESYRGILGGRMPPYCPEAAAIRFTHDGKAVVSHRYFPLSSETPWSLSSEDYDRFEKLLIASRDGKEDSPVVTVLDNSEQIVAVETKQTAPITKPGPLVLMDCPHCQTHVARTASGDCPSCRRPIVLPASSPPDSNTRSNESPK